MTAYLLVIWITVCEGCDAEYFERMPMVSREACIAERDRIEALVEAMPPVAGQVLEFSAACMQVHDGRGRPG